MTAQALYLKYRPQTFDEVVNQEPITQTLRNALRQDKLRHAYLLTGPRGTGKTTTARLLAKAVNCTAPEKERPCNTCPTCVAITEGRLLDLIEIDAASNRGIDEIRDIREKVGFRPNEGRFKVYVLDEAHMLTEPAFNALLKTLEEPPPHVIFCLVTTDPHKIPATITSRCQRFDFKRLSQEALAGRLAYIAAQEGVAVEPAALALIAQQASGAMRDAISLLDQLTSYGDEITLAQVQMVLGTVASEAAGKLAACLAEGDVAGGLDLINRTVGDGADPRQLARQVVEYLRGLLLIREGAGTRLLNATAEQAAEMETLAGRIPVGRLLRGIRLFNEAATDLRRGLQTIPQLPLEMALVESVLDAAAAQPAEGQTGPQAPAQWTPSQPASPPRAEARPVGKGPGGAPDAAAPSPPAQAGVGQAQPEPGKAHAEPAKSQAEPVKVQAGPASVQAEPVEADVEPAKAHAEPVEALALSQVQQAWMQVLQAVRQRNPATQAVLNSGCEPVEVRGDEVVVTFPFPFLRDKLGDPQRRAEIQDAMTDVLGIKCRLKLVLASEYIPGPQAASRAAANPAPASPAPQAKPPAADTAVAKGPPSSTSTAGNPTAGDQAGAEPVPEEVSRWVAEHGGEIKYVP